MFNLKSLIWRFWLNKRARFIISAFVLTGLLLFTQLVPFSWRYFSIFVLFLLSFLFSSWSLSEGISSWLMRLITAILPSFFSVGVAMFYFLFPESLIYQLLLLVFFGFAIYIIFLTENIFTVASIRTIALSRAAQTVGFLITLLTAFFWYNTIFSFRFFGWWNALLVLLVSFPLVFQALWSVDLGEKPDSNTLLFSVISSLTIGELSLIVSFFPVNVLTGSLFLTCTAYILIGLASARLVGRLFAQTVKEYLIVGGIMFLFLLLTTSWRG
ncbi:MAG: hypothetical protein PHX72_01085 [Candidatus Shapirobacteria bacterium]|nr:hypothetical protein [Candidatus Shapirobacteria bacterium]